MRKSRSTIATMTYVLFLLALLYLPGFLTGLWVTRSVDNGPLQPLALALPVDIGLLALFGIRHAVMNHPGMQRILTGDLAPAQRASIDVLATIAVLGVIYAVWLPIPTVIWESTHIWLDMAIWLVFGFGWGLAMISSLLLSPAGMARRAASVPGVRQPSLPRMAREQIYLGLTLAFWAIPTMTLGHLVFACGMTFYAILALASRAADPVTALGIALTTYRTVPEARRDPADLPQARAKGDGLAPPGA